PFFSYLESKFDSDGKDAWETLYSLPRVGRHAYSTIWWVGQSNPTMRPNPQAEMQLTVLGLARSGIFDAVVAKHCELLKAAVSIFRTAAIVNRREVRDRTLPIRPDDYLVKVIPREPAMGWRTPVISESQKATIEIPRNVLEYEGISSIDEYVERIEALTI